MQQTFDHYWLGYARWVVPWTNSVLAPPKPDVQRLLEAPRARRRWPRRSPTGSMTRAPCIRGSRSAKRSG
jgi:hypothetical protein